MGRLAGRGWRIVKKAKICSSMLLFRRAFRKRNGFFASPTGWPPSDHPSRAQIWAAKPYSFVIETKIGAAGGGARRPSHSDRLPVGRRRSRRAAVPALFVRPPVRPVEPAHTMPINRKALFGGNCYSNNEGSSLVPSFRPFSLFADHGIRSSPAGRAPASGISPAERLTSGTVFGFVIDRLAAS